MAEIDDEREFDAEVEAAYQAAVIGEAIEKDIRLSEQSVLRPILDRSRQASSDAMHDLIYADPTDTASIVRLQGVARRHRDLLEWIDQIVAEGEEAMEELAEAHNAGALDVTPPIARRDPEPEEPMNDA